MQQDDATEPMQTSEVIFEDAAEMERAFGRSPRRPSRIIQAGLVALAALLAGMLVFGHGMVPGIHPGPSATSGPILATIELHSTVDSGTVTVNGQKLDLPFFAGMHVLLRQTVNHVTLSAPPFHPVTCTITAPQLAVTGCDVTKTGDHFAIVQLPVTLHDLEPADRQAALWAAQQALDQTAAELSSPQIVAPGHVYAPSYDSAMGTFATQRASQQLQATVAFSAPFPADCPESGPSAMCTQTDLNFVTSRYTVLWNVDLSASFMWRFATANGMPVAAPTLLTKPVPLILADDPHTGWQAVGMTPNGAVQSLTDTVMENLCDMALNKVYASLEQGQTVQQISYTHIGVAGCDSNFTVVALEPNVPFGDARVLVRFGVPLAVGAEAHSIFPTLLVATPADLAAVG